MDLLELQGVWLRAPVAAVARPGPPVGSWLLRGVGRCWWLTLFWEWL